MYDFTDTQAEAISTSLPTEAVKINGSYIEDLIGGYKTLYVGGRESLAKEIALYDETKADGSMISFSRFPAREIVVGFQLISDSASDFRDSFNTLNTLLNVENAEIIFADEPDKYFIGNPIMSADIEPGHMNVTGEYIIYCEDPFKYSLTEEGPILISSAYDTTGADPYDDTMTYEEGDMVKHADGDIMKLYECTTDIDTPEPWTIGHWREVTAAAFVANNDGGYKAYPRFVANFAEDETEEGEVGTDGNSGFIQFAKVLDEATRYRIQFGDDEAELPVGGVGFDVSFTKNTLGGFANTSTNITVGSTTFKDTANVSTSTSGIKPKYGTSTGWHGSLITRSVTAADNFTLSFKQLAYLTDKAQTLGFMAVCLDSNNNVIAGVRYRKSSKASYNGVIDYIIGGTVKKTAKKQNFAKTGPYGYTKKTKKKASKIRNGESYIKRSGSVIKIKLAGDSKVSYFYPDSTPAVAKVGFFFVKNASSPNPAANYLRKAKFDASDTENAFTSGCTLEVDCSDASVLLDSVPAPELGDVGNEWSDFYLDVGPNTIFAAWSDWTQIPPLLEMYYQKRWL